MAFNTASAASSVALIISPVNACIFAIFSSIRCCAALRPLADVLGLRTITWSSAIIARSWFCRIVFHIFIVPKPSRALYASFAVFTMSFNPSRKELNEPVEMALKKWSTLVFAVYIVRCIASVPASVALIVLLNSANAPPATPICAASGANFFASLPKVTFAFSTFFLYVYTCCALFFNAWSCCEVSAVNRVL